jgi:hypothetical protein
MLHVWNRSSELYQLLEIRMNEYTTITSEDQKVERSTNTALFLENPLTVNVIPEQTPSPIFDLECLIATIVFKDKDPTK